MLVKLIQFGLCISFMPMVLSGYAADNEDEKLIKLRYAPITHHIDRSKKVNEENHMLAVEYNKWLLVTFKNSHYQRTTAFGYHLFYKEKFVTERTYLNVGLPAGIMYGYEGNQTYNVDGFTPFVFLNFGLGYKVNREWNVSAHLTYAPTRYGGVLIPEVQFQFPMKF